MKGLQMPISSPSRAENFPPSLVRFSRNNTASRSRGRSRSSPMLYLLSKPNAAGETIQEPSSPKVTCFGQVRVAKSKAKTASAKGRRRRRWLLRKTIGNISPRFRRQTGILRRIFCNCVFFSKSMEDPIRSYPDPKKTESPPNPRLESHETTKTESLDDSIPVPRNALILTRCRSAPYRSSSLGGRIWGSPFPEPEPAKSGESVAPSCEILSKISYSDRNTEEVWNSTANRVEESKGIGGDSIHPLPLTRCKSGPARTAERGNTEVNFWKQRREDTAVEPCSLDNSES